MNKFYSSISEVYDYIFPQSKAQVEFILSRTNSHCEKNILDIGCGTGNLSSNLAIHFKTVKAIDLDIEMVNKANEKYDNNNLVYSCVNMLKINEYFGTEKLNYIASFGNTLVHLDSPDEILIFFKETKKLLKKSGKLFIQIINYDRILSKKIKNLQTIDNEHIKFERHYNYLPEIHKIAFKTILTIKDSNQTIHNSVNLYPLLKEEIKSLLIKAGFNHIIFYGNFKGEEASIDSVPLIFEAY